VNTRNTVLGGLAEGAIVAGAAAGLGAALLGRLAFRELRRWREDDLLGKTVLITGGSRGLGLALAEEFARSGCKVVICARKEEQLQRARQQLEDMGAEVRAIACDLTRPGDIERMVQTAREEFGGIDVLVNNAGIISVGPLLSQTVEDFQESMNVIFWGTIHPTLAVLPEMIQRGTGRIVNITSIGGKVSLPHLLPYNCAKFAAVGFSEGLHAEVGKFGVHVLTVVPGLMRTGSHLNASFKGKQKQEYGWFALSGTNPALSVSARSAARQIVNATRRRQTELIVGWQAKLLAGIHGVAPGLTTEALAMVNRLMPTANGVGDKKTGQESESVLTRSPLTALGRSAARRYNQVKVSS
jgi:short-subunit dehydrogenase